MSARRGSAAATATAAAYRVNGERVARDLFYAVACDPRRSAVVEACAGAGKTWMLVSRMLRALLDGAEPHEVLAITFTKKAAGEMRERLSEWLMHFGDPSTGAAEREQALLERGMTPLEAIEAAPRLAALQEHLLAGGRTVQIHTFHAWFAQLLRGAPLELLAELGLQPEMALVENIDDLRAPLFRRFHAALLRDPALRDDYLSLGQAHGESRLRQWLSAALDKRIEIELADRAGRLEASVPPVVDGAGHPADCLREPAWRERLLALAALLGRGIVRAQAAARALLAAFDEPTPAGLHAALRKALFNGDGAPRRLGTIAGLEAAHADLDRLDADVQAHDACCDHRRMVRLARVLLMEYAALKRERRLLDMTDLERSAVALLRDAELAAWVQERLDARWRHVLIDEFQDTSPLQWQALQAWLAGYAGAGGGASGQRPPSVFIVGDPKQSIYRFRRAEPRVFDAARHFVREGLGGAVLACDHTRRNRPEVLRAVNAVFAAARDEGLYDGFREHTTELPVMPRGARAGIYALPGVARPLSARAPRGAAPAEVVWRDSLTVPRDAPEERLRRHEATRVAAAIAELVAAGTPPGDIMVLSRKRASLRLLAEALQAQHLPYASVEDMPLAESREVLDLIALLDALASPQHDLSLAQALRSPVFGVSDDDMVQLAEAARHDALSWWAALQASAQTALSPALLRARGLLERWREAALKLPPHDLLDRIVGEGDVQARTAAAVPPERRRIARAAIEALLGQSLALDGGRYASPYAFVRALRRRALTMAAPADAAAVQLLTVHGAKGLEAATVFLMDAEPEGAQDSAPMLLVDWPVEAEAPMTCAFVASRKRMPPALAGLWSAEVAANRREELNGLYVAMTRARTRFLLSHTAPHRATPDASWRERIGALAAPWPHDPAASGAEPAAPPLVVPTLPHWARVRDADTAAGALVDTPATRLGQAVHRALEWATSSSPGRQALDDAARHAAREFGLAPALAADVARLAGNILSNPESTRFHRAAVLRWAGNEVAVAVDGEVRRIDRLVQLADGDWWVLDYKLTPAPERDEADLAQLRAYRDAIAALEPGSTVHAAFITGAGAFVPLPPPARAPRSRTAAAE